MLLCGLTVGPVLNFTSLKYLEAFDAHLMIIELDSFIM